MFVLCVLALLVLAPAAHAATRVVPASGDQFTNFKIITAPARHLDDGDQLHFRITGPTYDRATGTCATTGPLGRDRWRAFTAVPRGSQVRAWIKPGAMRRGRPRGGWCPGSFRGQVHIAHRRGGKRCRYADALACFRVGPPTRSFAFRVTVAPGCAAAGSITDRENEVVRVYRIPTPGSYGDTTYACQKKTGLAALVGTTECDIDLCSQTPLALAGPMVGFADYISYKTVYHAKILVLDVPAARLIRSARPGERIEADRPRDSTYGYWEWDEGPPRVESLVLNETGSIAWIVGRETPQVRKIDSGGVALLDHGAGIVPESLTLEGSALGWRRDGQTRTSTLR